MDPEPVTETSAAAAGMKTERRQLGIRRTAQEDTAE